MNGFASNIELNALSWRPLLAQEGVLEKTLRGPWLGFDVCQNEESDFPDFWCSPQFEPVWMAGITVNEIDGQFRRRIL